MNFTLDITAGKLVISAPGLQDILIELNPDHVRFWQGTNDFLILTAAGGHWELNAGGGLPELPGGFEVTSDGHLLVHEV